MKKNTPLKLIFTALIIAMTVFGLAGCGGAQQNTQTAERQYASSGDEKISHEEAQALVLAALEQSFDSVKFSMETKTSATAEVDGQSYSQTVKTNNTGSLCRANDDVWLQMDYEARSSDQPGKTEYEMYIAGEEMIIVQGEAMYSNPMTTEETSEYVNGVVEVTNEEQITQLLDVARDCRLRTGDDGTKTLVITVDVDRLEESGIVDTSSLPEGSSVSTLVVTYAFDETNRFKSVRMTSNTVGIPTYRVNQYYEFYDYDQAQKPEWPDYESYIYEQMGLQRDADGQLYFTDDDGNVYYVDSISDDGMINFRTNSSATTEGYDSSNYYYPYDGDYYYYDDAQESGQEETSADTGTTQETPTADASDSSGSQDQSQSQGRAYITGYDGTVHYLDEEGSRIVDIGGGVQALVTADGGFFILSYGDEE